MSTANFSRRQSRPDSKGRITLTNIRQGSSIKPIPRPSGNESPSGGGLGSMVPGGGPGSVDKDKRPRPVRRRSCTETHACPMGTPVLAKARRKDFIVNTDIAKT